MTLSTLVEQEYKETELGLLPQGWKIADLGAVTKKRSELINPSGCLLKYVGLEHIDSGAERLSRHGLSSEVRSAKSRFYKGDVLYGKLRTYLDKCVIAEIEGICSTDIIVIEPEKIDGLFLAYSLHTRGFLQYSISSMTGVNHPRTSWDSLRKYVFPVPPLLEQKNIAFVLSKIHAAREKSENVISYLKELKKSLMKHLFTYGVVDFVSAEKVKLKETDIGEMPEEWSLKELQQVGVFQYGYTETTSEKEIGPKFVRITDINLKNNRIKWASVPYCKISDKECLKYVLNEEDILIARIGATTGKTCLIKKPPKSVFASYLIRFTSKNVSPPFIYYFTLSALYWKQVAANKEGKLKKGVSSSQLKKFLIPIPPLQEQKEIASILSSEILKSNLKKRKEKPLMNYSNQCFPT